MKNKYKKLVITGLIILFGFAVYYYIQHPLTATATINNETFILELAVTPQEKETGLGGKKMLLPKHGMLFNYDHKEQFGFWMKDMQFPLDFVWIDGTKVVDLTQNVPVFTNGKITTVQPSMPIDKVLELNAGEVEQYNIKIGDTVVFNK